MQGFIFLEFKHYIEQKHGIPSWDEIVTASGIPKKTYHTFVNYSYSDLVKLIDAVAAKEKKTYRDVLEDYGKYIMPKIWRISNRLIPKKWDLMDLLENTNHIFDRVMVNAISGQRAPTMRCERRGPTQITIFYQSYRKMCAFGIGMVKCLGDLYGCNVRVEEPTCMLRGDKQCEIIFHITKKIGRPDHGGDMQSQINSEATKS